MALARAGLALDVANPDEVTLALSCRSVPRGLLAAVTAALAAAGGIIAESLPALVALEVSALVFAWVAAVALFNRVRLEVRGNESRLSYGPIPWPLRPAQEGVRPRRLFIQSDDVGRKVREDMRDPRIVEDLGEPGYTRADICVVDEDGHTLKMRAGPPGGTIHALEPSLRRVLKDLSGDKSPLRVQRPRRRP
jgi:hypothetical protein